MHSVVVTHTCPMLLIPLVTTNEPILNENHPNHKTKAPSDASTGLDDGSSWRIQPPVSKRSKRGGCAGELLH